MRPTLFLPALAALALACAPSGPDIPDEWELVKPGMLRNEVEGLVGRKPDAEHPVTGRLGLTWQSRTHTLDVTLVGDKVDAVSINPKK